MAQRTNFVKVENLPPFFSDGNCLLTHFSVTGEIQDITAVDPTSVIVSYLMRNGAEQAAFALDGSSLAGNIVKVSLYFTHQNPQNYSNPVYQNLGQYIGQDHILFQPNSFQAFPRNSSSQHASPTHPNGPGFSMFSNLLGGVGNLLVGSSSSQVVQQLGAGVQSQGQASGSSTPSAGGTLARWTVPWDRQGADPGDQCPICLSELSEQPDQCLSLAICRHTFHSGCLEPLLKNGAAFLVCPSCRCVHGQKEGNMPLTGTISHRLSSSRLPGHESHGCIEVVFTMSPGVQGPEHPRPGTPYTPVGFPRVAFLPDNRQGLEMLHGLYIAFQQRLMFTVGTSLTTGRENSVIWNDIHLKTFMTAGEHGYPDPHHLDNLREELEGHGITQAEIARHMGSHQDLRTRGHL